MGYCESLPSKFQNWNDFHDYLITHGQGDVPIVRWHNLSSDKLGIAVGPIYDLFELHVIERQALAELKQHLKKSESPFTIDELTAINLALMSTNLSQTPFFELICKVDKLYTKARLDRQRQYNLNHEIAA